MGCFHSKPLRRPASTYRPPSPHPNARIVEVPEDYSLERTISIPSPGRDNISEPYMTFNLSDDIPGPDEIFGLTNDVPEVPQYNTDNVPDYLHHPFALGNVVVLRMDPARARVDVYNVRGAAIRATQDQDRVQR